MKLNRKNLTAAAVLATALAAGAYASAESAEPEAASVAQARIPLAQAVAAAEAKVPGKAARAELETDKSGRLLFDVEVFAGGKTWDVAVDAHSGAVLTASEDQADHDNDHDEKD
jgi:uncharacterized membrane protein YkoI